jgi:hypothetical protein
MAAVWKTGTEVLVKRGPFAGWRAAVVKDEGSQLLVFNGNSRFLVAKEGRSEATEGIASR